MKVCVCVCECVCVSLSLCVSACLCVICHEATHAQGHVPMLWQKHRDIPAMWNAVVIYFSAINEVTVGFSLCKSKSTSYATGKNIKPPGKGSPRYSCSEHLLFLALLFSNARVPLPPPAGDAEPLQSAFLPLSSCQSIQLRNCCRYPRVPAGQGDVCL